MTNSTEERERALVTVIITYSKQSFWSLNDEPKRWLPQSLFLLNIFVCAIGQSSMECDEKQSKTILNPKAKETKTT